MGKALAMRTRRWSYIRRLYEGPELYDRVADPGELTNVAGRPDVAAVEAEMKETLLEWLMATSDVIPWEPDPRQDPDLAPR